MGLAFGNHPDLMPPEGASILNVSNDSVLEALAIRIASAFKQHRIHINFSPDLSLFFHEILPGFDSQTEQLSNDIIHRTVLFQRLLFSKGIVVCPKGFSNFTAIRSTSLQAFIPTSNAIIDSLKKHTLTALADSGLMALTVNHFPSSYHSSEHHLTKPVFSDLLHRITPFAGLVISDLRDPRNDRLYLRKELYPAALLNGSDMFLIKDSLPEAIEIIVSEIGKSIS